MHIIVMLAIIFGGSVLALSIIGSTILIGMKIIRGGFSRKGQRLQSEEAKMIQEIHKGLTRMEERVEALETIILEGERKE
jgi:hypothetical protein